MEAVLWSVTLLQLAKLSAQGFAGFAVLRCGNMFSTTADVQPPIHHSSGVLVDWNLFSADDFCSDPAKLPEFKNLFLSEISLIATCPNCPQCSVVLPQQYELPITTTLDRIFLVTKRIPYNRPRTDISVHYVLVEKLPPSIKNCELLVGGRSASTMTADLNHPPMDWSNLLLVFIVLFAIVICTCSLRCACGRIFAASAQDARSKYSTASLSSMNRMSVSPAPPKFSTHLDHAGFSHTPTPSTIPRTKVSTASKHRSTSHEPFEARI